MPPTLEARTADRAIATLRALVPLKMRPQKGNPSQGTAQTRIHRELSTEGIDHETSSVRHPP